MVQSMARLLHAATGLAAGFITWWYLSRDEPSGLLVGFLVAAALFLFALTPRAPTRVSITSLWWFAGLFGFVGFVSPSGFGVVLLMSLALAVVAAGVGMRQVSASDTRARGFAREVGTGLLLGLMSAALLIAVVG